MGFVVGVGLVETVGYLTSQHVTGYLAERTSCVSYESVYLSKHASETEMRSAGDQRRSRKEAQHSHAIFAVAGLKIKPKVPLGRQHVWWLWLYSLFLKRTFCCLNAPGAAASSSSSSCLLAVCDRGFWSITATNWNRKIKHVLLSLIENKSYFHLPCFPNLQNVLLVRCLFHPYFHWILWSHWSVLSSSYCFWHWPFFSYWFHFFAQLTPLPTHCITFKTV